ncbi:CHAT domain-containing protein [Rhizoctonia solani]|nr:CHAT domain-containing protein [Rhizoctonia solani]
MTQISQLFHWRFINLGELLFADLTTKSINHAINLGPMDFKDPTLRRLLIGLSGRLWNLYEKLGDPGIVDMPIECIKQAIRMAPADHLDMPHWVDRLSDLYASRFKRSGNPEDLDRANEYQARVLSMKPIDHAHLPYILDELGDFYKNRFQKTGELNDLEKSIEYQSHAVSFGSDDGERLALWLHSLGNSHRVRFQRLGELHDIDKSIEHHSRAISIISDDNLQLSGYLNSLGNALESRFLRLRYNDDISKALEYKIRAVSLTQEDSPDLPWLLRGLANVYMTRFNHSRRVADIDTAIDHNSRALQLTPDYDIHLSDRLQSLGTSYETRFDHFGDPNDSDKAIEYKAHSISITEEGHPDLPNRLNSIGISYKNRFCRLGYPDTIEKAIENQTRAVNLTQEGHPTLPEYLSKLSDSHESRFLIKRSEDLGDAEKAIEYRTRAIRLTPENHAKLPSRLQSLGKLYERVFWRRDDQCWLAGALEHFRKASQSPIGDPHYKLISARKWVSLSFVYASSELPEACQTALNLMAELAWLGNTTNQRYEELRQIGDLALEVAARAIDLQLHDLALEWLEQARSTVWNQTLQLRTPLDHLCSVHPSLGENLQNIVNELQNISLDSQDEDCSPVDELELEKTAQEHRRLAEQYEMTLSKVRQLPGFEDFLRPRKFSDLLGCARNGPVVVINCHERRSDALVLLPNKSEILHVSLPNFSWEEAKEARRIIDKSLDQLGIRERSISRRPVLPEAEEPNDGFESVLSMLWTELAAPILDALDYRVNPPPDDLPRITWCLTGTTSFLPIHAAGLYDEPRSKLSDFAISSYTPTLSALLSHSSNSSKPPTGVLAIGQEHTPSQSRLPGTAKELSHIMRHTQGKICYTQLVDHEATTAAVLGAIDQHDWVHFACHAHQSASDPDESGFFLQNGVLELSKIRQRSFKNKGLAFLSACQTATGDKNLPDEAVHLASGMLMAGYPSVIGTMWSVSDADAPAVADKFYGQLLKDGVLQNQYSARALHDAVIELRTEIGIKLFERWVPYIHLGV